jgi:hypothetical protein
MKHTRSITLGVAVFWCTLAAAQSWRSFVRCEPSSGWTWVYWALHVLGLGAPLLAAIWMTRTRRADETPPGAAMTVVILAYVPMLVAMRLLELCLSGR